MTIFYNRTRTSPSIPRRLARQGKWHLFPLYWLLRTSDLGREGIDRSGSWRFADHIYRGQPGGRYLIGVVLDTVLLHLPAAASFRGRYRFVRDEVVRWVPILRQRLGRTVHVLSVPCGLPRDLVEAGVRLRAMEALGDARFWGLDLDPDALEEAHDLAEAAGLEGMFSFVAADAFDASAYPRPVDVITSTGLGEFLADEDLERFLRLCHRILSPGGLLLTTASGRHRLSDYLLREIAEIRAHYRTAEALTALLRRAGFARADTCVDRRGLQTYAIAHRGRDGAEAGERR